MIKEKKYIPKEIIDELSELGIVKFNEPLSKYTSFKTGGPADIIIVPKCIETIHHIIKILKNEQISITVIGGGTNLLVGDKGISGAVIKIDDDKKNNQKINIKDKLIYAEASTKKEEFIDFCINSGYEGIEFMAGIPGTIGGGIIMNAGTNLGCFVDILESIDIIDKNGILNKMTITKDMYSYRNFKISENTIVTGGYFSLNRVDDSLLLKTKIDEIIKEREAKHPVSYPSAGSVFKNPDGYSSWSLVDNAGLKGKRVGGAMVSELHTNFIINVDDATSMDIKNLIELIQEKVKSQFGVKLETEIRMIGTF